MLDADAIHNLALRCAPQVAPSTMLAIARVESGLDPLAIGVNDPAAPRPRPRTPIAAVATARALVAAGGDVDLGLGQINVRNLKPLGLSLEAAFDPCRNLAASAQILQEGYARGRRAHGDGQAALRVALSFYNTGDAQRGFANGYVARVVAQARPPQPEPLPSAPAAAPPAWDVFGRAALRTRFVHATQGAAP
jgi:type IV secretion system protein VirB1